jgi:HSP20 family protein
MTMAEKKEVASRGAAELEREHEPQYTLRPSVNIFEDDDRIIVQADMPGVSKDHLTVRVDGNNLLIEGEARIDMPEEMEALYADVRTTHYRRTFTLSNELDHGGISASLKDGVAEVVVPKRQEALPRKIEVSVE